MLIKSSFFYLYRLTWKKMFFLSLKVKTLNCFLENLYVYIYIKYIRQSLIFPLKKIFKQLFFVYVIEVINNKGLWCSWWAMWKLVDLLKFSNNTSHYLWSVRQVAYSSSQDARVLFHSYINIQYWMRSQHFLILMLWSQPVLYKLTLY